MFFSTLNQESGVFGQEEGFLGKKQFLGKAGRKRMISVLAVVNFRYLPLSAFFRISSMAAGVIIRVDLCCSKQRSPLSPVTRNSA